LHLSERKLPTTPQQCSAAAPECMMYIDGHGMMLILQIKGLIN
jgi:hypothetical protein